MAGGPGHRPAEAGGEESPESATDEALARRVQAGDRIALEVLVRRTLRPVHAVVASFMDDPDEVEDAAQESFLRALRAIDSYDPARPFAPWLYQIARNVARNRQAARGRWKLEPLPEEGMSVGIESVGHDSDPDPERAMELTEVRERIRAELHRLPEQRRTAFSLVDVEGMTAAEAGRIMGITPGTIRSHVHHARRVLREALKEFRGVSPERGRPDE